MTESLNEALTRAADLVRDKPEPWVSPDAAPMVEAWLRDAAEAAKDWEYWVAIQPHMRAAGHFAALVLGMPEDGGK